MRKLFLFGLIIFLLSVTNVFAIGIYPSSSSVDFTPNMQIYDKFTIHNNGNESMNIKLTKDGDLIQYVSFSNENYLIQPDERKEFYYLISLPPKLTPGKNSLRLGIVQIPDEAEGLSVAIGVETIISVNVPYPPQYIISDVFVTNTIPQKTTDFNITISSMGIEDVTASGKLFILDFFGDVVYSKDLGNNTFFSQTTSVIEERIDIANLVNGSYSAIVEFEYGFELASDKKQFSIGKPIISITSIKKQFMRQGEPGKIIVGLQNNYKGNVSFAASKLYIKDQVIKLDPMVLEPFENKTIEFQIETKYFQYGTYNTILEIPYESEIIEEDVSIFIFPRNIAILIISVLMFILILVYVVFVHIRGRE